MCRSTVARRTVALAAFALTLASATVFTPPPPLPSPPQQLHPPYQQPAFRGRYREITAMRVYKQHGVKAIDGLLLTHDHADP